MNSRNSSVGKTYENEFSEFLIKRILKAGGSLQIQHITGHLSQVRSEVKNAVANTKSDLIKFLKEHDNLFVIENDAVKLVQSSAYSTSGYDSDTSSVKSHPDLPPKIKNGKGVIVKLFPGYGFIKSKEPIKTEIFFNSLCFGDRNIDLTSFLHIGAIVFFHARRESSKFKNCKYHALKVWRIDNGVDESNIIIQKSRKNRETGLYDPLNLESEGIIQNIFPNLGFISVKGDDNNTVFFHKNRVVNYENIVDLTKVFSKGDRVEFTAHRSSKPDAKARWEATKVWKVSGKIQESVSQSNINELSQPKQSVPIVKNKTPEMITNQRGKIYPRSHGAVIKFGKNELADGDSAVYYVCGTQVTEIGWEFAEGDDVSFDAVKIKSAPGWKAVLVWTDTKPDIVLPTSLGDYSEFLEDDDDNSEICNSIYTSKSSLCMSESSNSSLKLEKLPFKTKDTKKEKVRKLSDCFVNKKLLNYKASSRDSLNSLPLSDKYCFAHTEYGKNKKLSKNSNSSSRDSLQSETLSDKCQLKSSEKIIQSSSNKSINRLNKVSSNWGDSSYPADEAYESMEASKSFKSNILSEYDNAVKSFTEDEVENSSEYASAEEEKVYQSSELENPKTSFQDNNLKCVASIKRYYDIEGEIFKVYPRHAEVKSSKFQNVVLFNLNDFYLKGISADELELDSLEEILKIGDIIRFNCFVIVDDTRQRYQKVSLAWKGSKPRHSNETSPEYFIKQNDLSVTITDEIDNDEMTDKDIQKKFLTSFVDETPDDNLSRTESCSEEEEEDSLTLNPKSEALNKSELPIDSESLSDTVYRILKRDVFSRDSVVDIKSLSDEVINIVLNHYTKKVNSLTCNTLSEARSTTESLDSVCSRCKENLSNSCIKTKATAVQTIITGDIISQNILPDW